MNLEAARIQMVEQQIRAWDVLDPRVLEVLARVPRERFVPAQYHGLAFADTSIPLAHGQVMMAPKVEGRLLQALDIQPDDTVLEIGTGSGFLAACLATLGGQVTSIDIFPEFAEQAKRKLDEQQLSKVTLETRDASSIDMPNRFNAIAVTGSLPVYDNSFEKALLVGGRLFVVVGEAPVMEALRITRAGEEEWIRESLFETVIPALINAPLPARFEF